VTTVPVSLVGAAGLHDGKLAQRLPLQPTVPVMHDWEPEVPFARHAWASPQAPVQVVLVGEQPGQQLSTLPQPSDARPHE